MLALAALLSGLLPHATPLGIVAGGVLDTGQVGMGRWWLGWCAAVGGFAALSWKWAAPIRLWWLGMLAAAIGTGVATFIYLASSGQVGGSEQRSTKALPAAASGPVVVLTGLPLFWAEGQDVGAMLSGGGDRRFLPIFRHPIQIVDHLDEQALKSARRLVLAQPRLLQPEELVALDKWVRSGGHAVIFADPLLVWPSELPPGDPRRAPVTSLLDPLLSYWGLRLEPASRQGPSVERRLLSSGHALMLAGASRFTLQGVGHASAQCQLIEQGLMALCRIGAGNVRLIADGDLLDDRLWLADPNNPDAPESWSADVPMLLDSWLDCPFCSAPSPPRRVVSEAVLAPSMRGALLVILIWVGLGWVGHKAIRAHILSRFGRGGRNESRTKSMGVQKMR